MSRRLALTCVLIAVMAGALALPAAGQARTYYPNCAAQQRYKPATVVVFCGDAGVVLRRMHWYSWGAREARGRTRYAYANTCKPTCVEGRFVRYSARVVLQRARTCPTNGRKVFTRMAVIWQGSRPASLRNFTQRLFCRPLG